MTEGVATHWEIRLVGGPHEGNGALAFTFHTPSPPEFMWIGHCRYVADCQAELGESQHPHLWFYIPSAEALPDRKGDYALYQLLEQRAVPFESEFGPVRGAVYYLLHGVALPKRKRHRR